MAAAVMVVVAGAVAMEPSDAWDAIDVAASDAPSAATLLDAAPTAGALATTVAAVLAAVLPLWLLSP